MSERYIQGGVLPFKGKRPKLSERVFVAPGASVIRDVEIGADSGIWYGCVLRGDVNEIRIGARVNLQDGTVIHLADDFPVIIGDYVTVGHAAVVHACVVEDECLIGMNSTILDGALIGSRSIVAAGSLVPQGMQVPSGSLVAGVPAKVKRALSTEEQALIKSWAEKYVVVAAVHSARVG